MRDGILVLNKPQEWTSSDCVAICRRVLGVKGIKKVGHGGTLDPMATGVLPIFVGQATRIMEYMELDYKTYLCEAKFGLVTDTLDIWGEVLEESDWKEFAELSEVSEKAIAEALMSFEGFIEQIPPMYSAVRIEGKRLYEYAYRGQEIPDEIRTKIKPRKVHIKSIDIKELDAAEGSIAFEVECSKGTYIRSLCSALGELVGCGCTMTSLTRIAVGNIGIENATITAEQVKTMSADELEALLLPADYPLEYFGKVVLKKDRADYFSRGNAIRWRQVKVVDEPNFKALLESGAAKKISGESSSSEVLVSDRELCAGEYEDIGKWIPRNARGRRYDLIYKVYEEGSDEFLGTGYYDTDARELKADKVFTPRRELVADE